MTELLPCPFCGSNRIIGNSDFYSGRFFKECINCNSTSPTEDSWNTRPSPWISIKEKLPKIYEYILVAIMHPEIGEMQLGMFVDHNTFHSNHRSYELKNITHWQPVTEPIKITRDIFDKVFIDIINKSHNETNWISSKIKPEKDGRYLVVEDSHYTWTGVCSLRNGKWDSNIKYWQTLPEPPKEPE